MKEEVLNDLRAHVERAVSGIPAGRGWRRRVGEELLAHLLAVYGEELAGPGGIEQAADRAKERLGRIDDLKEELGDSVPRLDRLLFRFQERELTMWRWLLPCGCVTILVGLGFVFPAVAKLRSQGLLLGPEVLLLLLGLALTVAGLGSLGWGMRSLRARSS